MSKELIKVEIDGGEYFEGTISSFINYEVDWSMVNKLKNSASAIEKLEKENVELSENLKSTEGMLNMVELKSAVLIQENQRLRESLRETNQHVIELLEYSEVDAEVGHVWANAEDGMYKAKQLLKELNNK